MKLSPKISMWSDYILSAAAACGLAMFLHHIAFYSGVDPGGPAWHWAFADHGLYGFTLLVFSTGLLIWRHKPKRGS